MVCIPSAANSWHKQHSDFIFLALFAIASSAAFMYWVTAQGPCVSPDSVTYIEAARNLLTGNGFVVDGKAITHYPPGYPLLIAAVDLLHPGNTIQAARVVAIFFFGANLVLVGLAVYFCTDANVKAASCAMLAFLSSAHVISAHAMSWSDAPFAAFSLASIILFSSHVASPRPLLLVLASVMAGFAVATRYVGIIFFPVALLALLMVDKRRLEVKLKEFVIYSGIITLPLLAWLTRNVIVSNSATNRELAFHPVRLAQIKDLISSAANFILPSSVLFSFKIILFSTFLLYFLHLMSVARENFNETMSAFLGISILFILTYIVFLFISVSFFDNHILFDRRILFPLSAVIIALHVSIGWFLKKNLWRLFLCVFIFLVGFNAFHAVNTAISIHESGLGYTSKYWNNLSLMKHTRSLPEDKLIYSNGNDIIRFQTERKAIMVPGKLSPGTMKPNENYNNEINKIIKECRDGKVIIVYFNAIGWRWYLPVVQELESLADLPVLVKNEDGVIYGTKN